MLTRMRKGTHGQGHSTHRVDSVRVGAVAARIRLRGIELLVAWEGTKWEWAKWESAKWERAKWERAKWGIQRHRPRRYRATGCT